MITSILDDIKNTFRYGNKVNRLIIVNTIVFVALLFVGIFLNIGAQKSEIYQLIIRSVAIPSHMGSLLLKPWTLITHMFVHEGFWHFVWNMLLFFWFAKIVGDLIGDNFIIPLYIMGGLSGAVFFLISSNIGVVSASIALGASAAVMTFVGAAATISPDYSMNLILIGPVKIKYIAFFLILMDLVSISNNNNTGGHIAHLGGVAFGVYFVYELRRGKDLTLWLQNLLHWFNTLFEDNREAMSQKRKRTLTVVHKSKDPIDKQQSSINNKAKRSDFQDELDRILDKIKDSGYDNLSEEEKEFLFQASKK